MTAPVMIVCTANICRSPVAERLLTARLSPSLQFVSRGVRAVPGAPMCEVSGTWALVNGADPGAEHRSRQLEQADVDAAVLVLTASERHKAAVVALRPTAQLRTYTLKQAARIIRWRAQQGVVPPQLTPAERLQWLVDELDAHRRAAPLPRPAVPGGFFGRGAQPADSDSLPDPHEGGGTHPDVLAALTEALAPIIWALR